MSVLVCMPTTRKPHVVSSVRRCGTCGCEVWVSPSSEQELARDPSLRITCTAHGCVTAALDGAKTVELAAAPGADEEVAAALRPKEGN